MSKMSMSKMRIMKRAFAFVFCLPLSPLVHSYRSMKPASRSWWTRTRAKWSFTISGPHGALLAARSFRNWSCSKTNCVPKAWK